MGIIGVGCVAAQHQTVYEDSRVRILDVQIDSTLPHRHDKDHVWVADSGIHFSRGGVTRVERNGEVMIELLQRQTNPRNVCGEVLPREYLHCREPLAAWLGANLQIQFETDQAQIGILQIAPNAALAIPPADVPPLLIALEGTEAEAVSHANGARPDSASRRILKLANVFRSPADLITEIRNTGKSTARFLVVEFAPRGE